MLHYENSSISTEIDEQLAAYDDFIKQSQINEEAADQ